ncbi:MAG: pro-sigmaK processing inhibitor BofA family protein [Bacilli bacterium]|nr:pro-sigmaK processing inhibitor BofA family protein [Bacilli bacterium]
MLKQIFNILKKIVLAAFILYGFNMLISPLSIIIPINIITLLIVSFLGFSGLLGLVIILLVAL